MQQDLAAAKRSFCISNSFHQQLFTDFLFCNRFPLHKFFQFLDIFKTIISQANSFSSVTSRTSCLLVVSFQAFRNIIVNNKTYIWFINTHTKSNSSNDYVYLFHQELILIGTSSRCIHSCMIRGSLYTVNTKNFSKFFNFFTAQAVNNSGFTFVIFDELDNIFGYISLFRPYFII